MIKKRRTKTREREEHKVIAAYYYTFDYVLPKIQKDTLYCRDSKEADNAAREITANTLEDAPYILHYQ